MADEGRATSWKELLTTRLPELTAQGLSSREAMQRLSEEWSGTATESP